MVLLLEDAETPREVVGQRPFVIQSTGVDPDTADARLQLPGSFDRLGQQIAPQPLTDELREESEVAAGCASSSK
jgi:hypothetical protein